MSNKLVKVILADNQVFPQTVAEAVLVNGNQVTTLDKVLPRKIEQVITPDDSGLTTTKQGIFVTITHTNKITPNKAPKSYLIQYDQNGHIIKTDSVKKQIITVNNVVYSQYDGNTDSNVNFGDDFTINNNNISLTWNDINNSKQWHY